MIGIPSKKIKKLHIIINPAAGKVEPILPVINTVMKDAGVDWEVSITKKALEATTFAREAVKKGFDAVAIYGGDGSVMEAISGMIGSDVPLVILPGGSANVLATELKIPRELKAACQLITSGSEVRAIDVGEFNKRYFILRLGLGFEAEMVKAADRQTKARFGQFAYVMSSATALQKIREAKYNLEIDGTKYQARGITCIVANSGNIGLPNLAMDKNIEVSDGLLDVFIVRRVNMDLFAYIFAVIWGRQDSDAVEVVQRWQGKEIKVSSTPKQVVQCDGEICGKVPIHARVLHTAINILVPVEVSAPSPAAELIHE